jgi:hypothetical protein
VVRFSKSHNPEITSSDFTKSSPYFHDLAILRYILLSCAKVKIGGVKMVINQKTLVFLTLVPVCLLLGCFSVRGEAVASDPLWMQAVQLAGRNQDLMPGKLYKQTKELNFFGRVRSTEESWSDFVEAEDGKVECKEVKKICQGDGSEM